MRNHRDDSSPVPWVRDILLQEGNLKHFPKAGIAIAILLYSIGLTPFAQASGIYRPPRVKTTGPQNSDKKEDCKPGPEGDECRKKRTEKKETAG